LLGETPVPKTDQDGDPPVQILLRFPVGLRRWLEKKAKDNGRSLNAEVVDRLVKSKANLDAFQQLQETVEQLCERVENLESESHSHSDPNPDR